MVGGEVCRALFAFSWRHETCSHAFTLCPIATFACTPGWVEFSMRTVQLMIALFDTDRSRTIGPKEFESLYNFLVAWYQQNHNHHDPVPNRLTRTLVVVVVCRKKCFDGIDADKSGAIDYKELQAALVQLGYRLESVTLNNIFRYYDGVRRRYKHRQPMQLKCQLTLQHCVAL